MTPTAPQLVYLAWGRLQRPRANLVQTLHTVDALAGLGVATRLYLPPWPRDFDVHAALAGFGVAPGLDLRPSALLHRRWRGWPFLLARGRLLRGTVTYTRVPALSVAMTRLGIPHALEVHDTAALQDKGLLEALCTAQRNGLIRLLLPISARAADVLYAAGADPARVHVAPSGVDLAAYAGVPELTVERLREPRIIYLGRISRDRGLGVFEALAGHYAVRLVGPCEEAPTAAIECLPPIPHADVPRQYADAEIALMPYQQDLQHAASISPIKLFEAMAAGRCVVASDLPALREVLRDGENALLVPPDEPAAWIAAVERLRQDPVLALRIAAAGRTTAAGYGWDARARGIASALGLRLR